MKKESYILILLLLFVLPNVVFAQNVNTHKKEKKQKEIKVNKIDVIYSEDEFSGKNVDPKEVDEEEGYIIQVPYQPLPDFDFDPNTEDGMPLPFSMNDEGAESEDDILKEGFDTAIIHLPKFNVATITDPIYIRLTDSSKGMVFTWPTPMKARPSSHFGPRRKRFHYGLDLALPTGEPIYAAFDGIVRVSKLNRSYGNLVIIHHDNGLETYYAHMSKRNVVAGQRVKSGQVIGLCGNTGRSFGSHLHFEIRYIGNPMNPENIVSTKSHNIIQNEIALTSASFRKVAKGRGGSNSAASSNGYYTVKKGDTLSKIAARHGISVAQLRKWNGLTANSTIRPGQRLKVSSTASAKKTTTKPAPKPAATPTDTTTKVVETPKEPTVSKPATDNKPQYYTVRKGDNLYSIAKRHGTTLQQLYQLNGMNKNSKLLVGQKIRVK